MAKHRSGSYPKVGPEFSPERGGAAARVALKSRGRIAHIEASEDHLDALEVRTDCPSCGIPVLVEVEARAATRHSRPAPAPVAPGAQDVVLSSVVRKDIPVMPPDFPVFGILGKLSESRAPLAVVVDQEGAPKGVLTALDLYDALERHGPGSLADVDVLATSQSSALTLREDTRMSSVVRLFLETRPDCIVAVDGGGRLSGVVTPYELLMHVLG